MGRWDRKIWERNLVKSSQRKEKTAFKIRLEGEREEDGWRGDEGFNTARFSTTNLKVRLHHLSLTISPETSASPRERKGVGRGEKAWKKYTSV
jgi:hypothetical protein